MTHHARILFTLVWFAGAGPAAAIDFEASSTIILSTRDCEAGESPCDRIGPMKFTEVAGTPANSGAEANLDDPSYGWVSAEVALAEAPGGTRHHTAAGTRPGARNAASSFSVQKFVNDGDTPLRFVLVGTLTWAQTVPEENAGIPSTGGGQTLASADLGVVRSRFGSLDGGDSVEENHKAVLEGLGEVAQDDVLGQSLATSPANEPGQGTRSTALDIEIGPGEIGWVWISLQGIAANGSEVSATLVTDMRPAVEPSASD